MSRLPDVAAALPGPRLPREIVLASAGSGKTYRIASRIIGLLAHGQSVDSLLAATFTRKAAGEILGRVLERLARAALDPRAAATLARDAALGTPGAPDPVALDSARCLELLRSLLRELHRLSIGTLDSFFMRTAGVLARELGLPPAWTVADEATAARLRAEALREVLQRGDRGTDVELVRLINRGGTQRAVHAGLLRRLERLQALHAQTAEAGGAASASAPEPAAASEAAAAPGTAGAIPAAGTSGLRSAWQDDPAAYGATDAPGDVEALAAAFEALEVPCNRDGSPKKSWVNGLEHAAAALRARDWNALLGVGLVQKVSTGEVAFDRVVIGPDAIDAVQAALEAAHGALARELAAQAGAMRRLVLLFDEALARVRRREGAYGFDDVTRLLGASHAGARPDLGYRLDMRLRHLLLDEFQDTSVPQWQALRPLVEAVLAEPAERRAAIVVADGKQSIYGWRGASPELVNVVERLYPQLEPCSLKVSYRSSPVILDAVNQVFEWIARRAWEAGDDEVVADWCRRFEAHRAHRSALPGYVSLQVGPNEGGRSDHRPLLLRHTAGLVERLQREMPGFSIGVLVRENRAVARLIYELRELGVTASEEGGNSLADSPAVASVLALLRLADHPDDGVARYQVARTPVGGAVGLTDERDGAAARRAGEAVRQRLLQDGYGRTLAWLARRLSGACDGRDARRLAQLAEAGFRYDARATLRPMDFVRAVQRERVEDPNAAALRVMTVHQAKGLEFDIVVLPELDAQIFKGGGREALPFRADAAGPITQIWPPVGRKLLPLFPAIAPAYAQARAAVLRDALSGLYVAMTRARHALYLVLRADPPQGSTAFTAARLVREALAPDAPATMERPELFAAGDPDWHRAETRARAALPAGRPAAPAGATRPELDGGRPRHRMLPRRTPSGLEGGTRVDLAAALRLDRRAAERGTLVHAWCEHIGWLEDGLPTGEALERIARHVDPGLTGDQLAALAREFRRWLAAPAVAASLSRARYAEGAVVENERPFLQREGGALVHGKIDRLVRWSQNGRLAGAEVLDFKTDAVQPEGLPGLVEHYRPQMEAYRAAVAAAFGLEPGRVRATLIFLAAGEVREVPGER